MTPVEPAYRVEGPPHGAPVVLLHGWCCDAGDWRWFAPEAARRYRVVVPDLRGHGRSPVTANGYDVRTLAADVAGLLERLGTGPAAVVGHSLGAAVASVLAVEHPALVRAVVAVDPAYGRPPGHDARVAALLRGPRRGADLAEDLFAGLLGPGTPAWRAGWYRRRIRRTPAAVIEQSLAGLWIDGADVAVRPAADAYLARRPVPVLALHADADAAEWERGATGAHVEHWAGVTHFLHHDRPARFAETVLAWLARH